MIMILRALKQPCLSAISAEQLLLGHPLAPKSIKRFDAFSVYGQGDHDQVISTIKASHLFFNPTKHDLIFNQSQQIKANDLFFHIKRKVPINQLDLVHYLNQQCSEGTIDKVFLSDIWTFSYSDISNIPMDDVLRDLVISSPNNQAPFSHPHIHNADVLRPADLIHALTNPSPFNMAVL
jgi:hypothetical protein